MQFIQNEKRSHFREINSNSKTALQIFTQKIQNQPQKNKKSAPKNQKSAPKI